MGIKRKWLWTVVTIVLAVLTFWAVMAQNGNISAAEVWASLLQADQRWIFVAFLGAIGFIWFEGYAVILMLDHIGYKRSKRRGFLYGAADVYFSAITPSASGGQPAQAFLMANDGVPMSMVTAVLLMNLIMYTVAVLVCALVFIPMHWQMFLEFSIAGRLLILVGSLTLISLAIFFYLLLRRPKLLFSIVGKVLGLLKKLHLVKRVEDKMEKLKKAEEEYHGAVILMSGSWKMITAVFLCNVGQRLSQLMVTVAVYMGLGGIASKIPALLGVQCLVVLGSNSMPVPGGMGVTDYLMLTGYTSLFGKDMAVHLEMLSRGFSFYVCIFVSALTVFLGYSIINWSEKRKERKA